MAHQVAPGGKSGAPWRFSLFSCFGKCGTCCYGFWCLPCLYGQNVSDAEPGSSCFLNCLLYYCLAGFGCCCLVHMQSRSRLRAKYGLMEKPCGDCCVTYFCAPCAVCQEANEIRDKSKNAAPMYGTQMAPPPQQQMHGGQYPPQQYPPPSGAAPPAQY